MQNLCNGPVLLCIWTKVIKCPATHICLRAHNSTPWLEKSTCPHIMKCGSSGRTSKQFKTCNAFSYFFYHLFSEHDQLVFPVFFSPVLHSVNQTKGQIFQENHHSLKHYVKLWKNFTSKTCIQPSMLEHEVHIICRL